MRSIVLAGFMALAMSDIAMARDCILSGSEDDTVLSGLLDHEVFPGPPNFADVTAGDEPQPTYILVLDSPVCLAGDDFIDETRNVRRIHLAFDAGDNELKNALRSMMGENVEVALRDAFGAHTGHHHAPIVAFVTGVWRPGENDSDDDGGEAGTPATTVRGFYLALEVGDGETASSFVIPEKRDSGPFAPDSLSSFYGNLKEPLELHSVRRIKEKQYEARYTFETHGGKFCDGISIVNTTVRSGRNLIERIKAPNGC